MPRWSLEKRSMLRKLSKDVFKVPDPENDNEMKDPGKKINRKSFKIETPCFMHFMESWNFDFYKEIDLPECTGNGDGPEFGGRVSLLNGGRGWGSILSVSSL